MTLYRGRYGDRGLFVLVFDPHNDAVPPRYLRYDRAAKLNRSQHGLATGASNAGTHCLALALLLDVIGVEDAAIAWHRDFANVFLYRIPYGDAWEIDRDDIVAWLGQQAARAAERATVAALAVERERI